MHALFHTQCNGANDIEGEDTGSATWPDKFKQEVVAPNGHVQCSLKDFDYIVLEKA